MISPREKKRGLRELEQISSVTLLFSTNVNSTLKRTGFRKIEHVLGVTVP